MNNQCKVKQSVKGKAWSESHHDVEIFGSLTEF